MKSMINWFSIPCTDFERAVTFYNAIFAIDMAKAQDPAGNDMAFFFAPEDGIAGAINSDPSLKPGAEGPRIYLNADGQLDEVLGRVAAAGGEVVVPRSGIDQWGSIGVIKDTEGNVVGVHSLT